MPPLVPYPEVPIVGVVMFLLLTGRLPFRAANQATRLQNACKIGDSSTQED